MYWLFNAGEELLSLWILADYFRYHVPRSWLKPKGNLLDVFEELVGDPSGIVIVRREIDSVCADISEWQPSLRSYKMQASGKVNRALRPKVHLSCGPGQKISSIKFASFGTPVGSCGNYQEGKCHAHKSYDAFQRVLHPPPQLCFCFSFSLELL